MNDIKNTKAAKKKKLSSKNQNPSVGVQPNVILKDRHTIDRQRVYHAQAVVSNLFFLLCSRKDNPKLARQYKEQIDSLIDEFSPFIFQEQQ